MSMRMRRPGGGEGRVHPGTDGGSQAGGLRNRGHNEKVVDGTCTLR